MIGTSDQSCWLAEACKILLLLKYWSRVSQRKPSHATSSRHQSKTKMSQLMPWLGFLKIWALQPQAYCKTTRVRHLGFPGNRSWKPFPRQRFWVHLLTLMQQIVQAKKCILLKHTCLWWRCVGSMVSCDALCTPHVASRRTGCSTHFTIHMWTACMLLSAWCNSFWSLLLLEQHFYSHARPQLQQSPSALTAGNAL